MRSPAHSRRWIAGNVESLGALCHSSRADRVDTSATRIASVCPPAKVARQSPGIRGCDGAESGRARPAPPPGPNGFANPGGHTLRGEAPPPAGPGGLPMPPCPSCACCPKGVPGRRVNATRFPSGDHTGAPSKSTPGARYDIERVFPS
jgi:hypothetical protein